MPDKPWMMAPIQVTRPLKHRMTLSDQSAKGQTGLSIALTFRHKPVSTLMPNSRVKSEKLCPCRPPWPYANCSTASRLPDEYFDDDQRLRCMASCVVRRARC